MKISFSKSWNSSTQPRKQRKYVYNSPLHIKRNFLSSHLSVDLRKKQGMRSTTIRVGDKVKVMRGNYKNKLGRVERVLTKKTRVYISSAESVKKDGTKLFYPIHPSNLMITELNLDDKKRFGKKTAEKSNEKSSAEKNKNK